MQGGDGHWGGVPLTQGILSFRAGGDPQAALLEGESFHIRRGFGAWPAAMASADAAADAGAESMPPPPSRTPSGGAAPTGLRSRSRSRSPRARAGGAAPPAVAASPRLPLRDDGPPRSEWRRPDESERGRRGSGPDAAFRVDDAYAYVPPAQLDRDDRSRRGQRGSCDMLEC